MRWSALALVAACSPAQVGDLPGDGAGTDAVGVDTGDDGAGDGGVAGDSGAPDDSAPPGDSGESGTPASCAELGPVAFELGTGEEDFEALTEGQTLAMVHGPQGGWHLTMAVHGANTDQFVSLEYRVVDVQSQTTITAMDPFAVNVALVPPVLGTWGCEGSYTGLLGILDFTALGGGETAWEVLACRTVSLQATLYDAGGGALASDAVEVVVMPDPRDVDSPPYICP